MEQPTIPDPAPPPMLANMLGRVAREAYTSDQGVRPSGGGMSDISIDRLITYLQWLRTQNHQRITWNYNDRFLDIHLYPAEYPRCYENCDCAVCEFYKAIRDRGVRQQAEWVVMNGLRQIGND